MQFEDMVSISAGPSQLIAALCDEIGLEDQINRSLTWDPAYCKVSPGTHIKAMVINILCSGHPCLDGRQDRTGPVCACR
ncbi:DUF4277 domain-containing protein [Paenibacillus sp. IB182496]|uniref:DUF4277 domain-containing protein n=1 Tax=Paenibacillus sabuli TaxID=2772509 RepID=A0A927GQN0_9BACL|nr:DUF4277 domain-containing protein [Paenibacillus sabuli]MBD2844065.1 DUF4277 domain-containing protein [Paenibacillus sabuli]